MVTSLFPRFQTRIQFLVEEPLCVCTHAPTQVSEAPVPGAEAWLRRRASQAAAGGCPRWASLGRPAPLGPRAHGLPGCCLRRICSVAFSGWRNKEPFFLRCSYVCKSSVSEGSGLWEGEGRAGWGAFLPGPRPPLVRPASVPEEAAVFVLWKELQLLLVTHVMRLPQRLSPGLCPGRLQNAPRSEASWARLQGLLGSVSPYGLALTKQVDLFLT